ncbi:MAG: allene oxide cyclase barrel-like domain-containing protein [Actinomycetota bacterium]
MRKLAVAAASVLALVGALVGPAAPAAWADHPGDTLEVVAKFTDFDKKDLGDKGPSEGDVISFAYKLLKSTGDHEFEKVGHGGGGCLLTEVDVDDHVFDSACKAVFALEDGKIVTVGTVSNEDMEKGKISMPIVAGTDDYADAEGKAVIEFVDHGKHGDAHPHGVEVAGHHEGGDGDMEHGDGHDGDKKKDGDMKHGDGHGMGLAKVTFVFE